MNNKQIKLENSARLEALRPTETLNRIGIHQNDTICDIGAGSGVFTLPAAAMTKKTVFALDMDEEMLAEIRKKAKNEGIQNIELIKVFDDHFAVPDNMIDIILMVTVLHEITNTGVFLEEAKRLLKRHGKIALIEFHKYTTKMGAPSAAPHRKRRCKKII